MIMHSTNAHTLLGMAKGCAWLNQYHTRKALDIVCMLKFLGSGATFAAIRITKLWLLFDVRGILT